MDAPQGSDFPGPGANHIGDIQPGHRRMTLRARWRECPLFASFWAGRAGPEQNTELRKVYPNLAHSLPHLHVPQVPTMLPAGRTSLHILQWL